MGNLIFFGAVIGFGLLLGSAFGSAIPRGTNPLLGFAACLAPMVLAAIFGLFVALPAPLFGVHFCIPFGLDAWSDLQCGAATGALSGLAGTAISYLLSRSRQPGDSRDSATR